MKKLLFFFCLIPFATSAQKDTAKGDFYFSWGYNRGWYTKSDIHFKGPGYDFTLWDAAAHDFPEEVTFKNYAHPLHLTIPQFNFRAGYFFDNKYSISLGWDHMKYYMSENINVNVTGYIEDGVHEYYSFDLNNEPFFLARNFIEYEHSDGFNYVRLNVDRYDHFFSKGSFNVSSTAGIGFGGALTWSDFSWGSTRFRNKPHMSGINVSLNTGVQFDYKRKIFLNSSVMGGQSWLTDVRIRHGFKEHQAKQQFQFLQFYTVVGYRFRFK